jgi:hypothetical protein
MLGAISFDTLAFIALVIIASFFRWISKEAEKAKRKSEEGERSPARPAPVQPREDSDEQRVRRFLEALGQPTSSQPPRPIEKRMFTPKEKRVAVPRKRNIFSQLPPLTTAPPPLPVEPHVPSFASPPVVEPDVSRAAVALISAKEEIPLMSSVVFPETPLRASIYPEITALLSSKRGLRDAIVLREIFGPPRSLQTIEF